MSEADHSKSPCEEGDKKDGVSAAFIATLLITLLCAIALIIAMVIVAITQTPAEVRYRNELEKLQFTNIELKNTHIAGGAEAWVSVGGCRVHLKRGFHEDDTWQLTGESVVAGIFNQPTADIIRNHPEFQECARKPAPQPPPS